MKHYFILDLAQTITEVFSVLLKTVSWRFYYFYKLKEFIFLYEHVLFVFCWLYTHKIVIKELFFILYIHFLLNYLQ
jgi:hypothetical protein